MMTTMVLAQKHQNHNMIKKKTNVINNEKLNKNLHFCNQSLKKKFMNDESWVTMNIGTNNNFDQQFSTTSKAS